LQSEGQRQVDRLQNINKQLVEGQMDWYLEEYI
jgi:hypothetical protein